MYLIHFLIKKKILLSKGENLYQNTQKSKQTS